jgi:hypothetical protein
MSCYSLSHLADRTLLRELTESVSQDRNTTARMLAQIAEVDERRLYLPAGYSSMFLYCLHELRMSEDVAYKRIRAARAARQFPAILPALADGRLHLAAVVLLTPHLTPDTSEELLAAAQHRTKAEIELLLAQRFPQPDAPTLLQAITPAALVEAPASELAPGPVVSSVGPNLPDRAPPLTQPLPTRTKPAPLSPGRFLLQTTVDQETYDQLRYAQELLGHALPSDNVAEVLKRALGALVEKLEKRKFAKGARSSTRRRAAHDRHIPAAVRRAVLERDHGQCTFVSAHGKRCESRTRLEYDHVEPVARGGQTSVANIRLRCRPHNQYAADCTYGPAFMRGKREQARSRSGMPECVVSAPA